MAKKKTIFSETTYQRIWDLALQGKTQAQICEAIGASLDALKKNEKAVQLIKACKAEISEKAEKNYNFMNNLISAIIAQIRKDDPNLEHALEYALKYFMPELYKFLLADAARRDKNKKDLRNYYLKKEQKALDEYRAKLEERRVKVEEARLELERQKIELQKPEELPALSCRPMTAEEEWEYMADGNKEGLDFEAWKRETHPDE